MRLVLLLLLISTPCFATPVDVQKISDKEGLSGALDFSYSRQSGYKDKTSVDSSLTPQYQNGRHLVFGTLNDHARFNKGEDDGSSVMRHLRYRYSPFKIGLEAFAQREWNHNTKLLDGVALGLGPYVQIIQSAFGNMVFGTAYTYEQELFQEQFDYISNERMYTYLSGSVRIPGFARVSTTFHGEPSIKDKDNCRLYNLTSVKFRTVENSVTFGLNYNTSYNSHPTLSVPSKNTEFTTSVGWDF